MIQKSFLQKYQFKNYGTAIRNYWSAWRKSL